jgi:voltage-gated potassium channel
MSTTQWDDFARSDVAKATLRAVVSTSALLLLYSFFPIESRPHERVILRVIVALVLFIVILGVEMRAIVKHDQPMLRAGIAVATVLPAFVLLFAWLYLTMSISDPAAFGVRLSRIDALYFTVTVFSTVGFGDINAKTEIARVVTTVQMLADIAVIAVVVRLIFGTASRALGQQSADNGTTQGSPG